MIVRPEGTRASGRLAGFVHIVNKCAHTVRSQYSVRTICWDGGGTWVVFGWYTESERVESWVALLKVTHQGKIACCVVVEARIDSLTSSLPSCPLIVTWLELSSAGPSFERPPFSLTHSLTHSSPCLSEGDTRIERSFNIPSFGCSFAHMVLEYSYGQTWRRTPPPRVLMQTMVIAYSYR